MSVFISETVKRVQSYTYKYHTRPNCNGLAKSKRYGHAIIELAEPPEGFVACIICDPKFAQGS